MKSLMSITLLLPMLFSAARAASPDRAQSRYAPRPEPRECPEGTRREFDEYQGRYVCVPFVDRVPRPCPLPDNKGYDKLGAALGGEDMSAKGEALNGLFDAMKAGEAKDAVAAGPRASAPSLKPSAGWRLAHTDPSVPVPPTGPKPRPGGDGVRFMTVGAVDDLGNKLRDRNDKKLEEATKQQKETEKRWKDYKEGKSVSPHPPTADEISIGGKG